MYFINLYSICLALFTTYNFDEKTVLTYNIYSAVYENRVNLLMLLHVGINILHLICEHTYTHTVTDNAFSTDSTGNFGTCCN